MKQQTLHVLVVFALAAAGCLLAAAAEDAENQPRQNLDTLVRRYAADREEVRSFFELPASQAYLERVARLETRWLEELKAVDFDALTRPERVDYLLLENELHKSLTEIARQRKQLDQLKPWVPFGETILALEEARWQAAPLDNQEAATKLGDLAKQVKDLRDRVQKANKSKDDKEKSENAEGASLGATAGSSSSAEDTVGQASHGTRESDAVAQLVVSPPLALRAGQAVQGLADVLKRWFTFYQGYQPEFDWWVKKPYDDAQKQLEQYGKLLREEIAGQKGKPDDSLVGEPLGAEAIAADLRFELLPYTAEEVIAIGQSELAWCEDQMKAASREMGLGEDWKAALARVKADFVPPGKQAALAARIGREATALVVERKLVSVPPLCRQTWRLTMISPEQLKTIPYAAYGDREMMVAYPRNDMDQADKLMIMRGNNRHFMRLVTPHELIPGHRLQAFYAARYNTHRQLFGTPFYSEGWALYWELRLWDLGWAHTPEDRIGMLFWRMTRAARIIVSLNYHLGRMTPAEMIDFLVERVGHERLGATNEVRRYLEAPPLYQAGYLVGGLQFYALHKELVQSGKMTEPAFHDAVLKQNAMPVELLRADLLGMELSRQWAPSWRFAD